MAVAVYRIGMMFTMTPSHGEWDGDSGIRAPYAMGPWLPWWCQKFLNQWIWGYQIFRLQIREVSGL